MGAPEQKKGLAITPAANGGWVVDELLPGFRGEVPYRLAAVSSAADLVKWLSDHLEVDLSALDVRVKYSCAQDIFPLSGLQSDSGEVDRFDDAIDWARDINTCKACHGFGLSPKGRKCLVCHGTGQCGVGSAPSSVDENPEGGDA